MFTTDDPKSVQKPPTDPPSVPLLARHLSQVQDERAHGGRRDPEARDSSDTLGANSVSAIHPRCRALAVTRSPITTKAAFASRNWETASSSICPNRNVVSGGHHKLARREQDLIEFGLLCRSHARPGEHLEQYGAREGFMSFPFNNAPPLELKSTHESRPASFVQIARAF